MVDNSGYLKGKKPGFATLRVGNKNYEVFVLADEVYDEYRKLKAKLNRRTNVKSSRG